MSTKALAYIGSQHWAVLPVVLANIRAVARRDIAAIDTRLFEAVVAREGRPMDDTKSVTMRNGVATIPVHGVIDRYSSRFQDICGGTSVQAIAKDLTAAVDSPMVRAVIMNIDSPGGNINGVGELAAMIRKATETKPVVAYVSHLGCSAAYWLASACSEVVAAPTAMLGSIGVQSTYDAEDDDSEMVMTSSQSPLKNASVHTEAGKDDVQRMLDEMCAVFINAVAEYRGCSPAKVESDFGMGSEKIGQAAVDAGMADAVGDYEGVLMRLCRGEPAAPKPASRPKTASAEAKPKGNSMFNPFKALASLWETDKDAVEKACAAAESELVAEGAKFTSVLKATTVKTEDQIRAEIKAEFEAKANEDLKAFLKTEAESFVATLIKAEKALPAESAALVLRYVDAALTDRTSPLHLLSPDGTTTAVSRLGAFTNGLLSRGENGLTKTQISPDAKTSPAALEGLSVLPETAGSADEAKAAAEAAERHNLMLLSTELGRKVLAQTEEGRKLLASHPAF